jgi:signal transduction histidine kinase
VAITATDELGELGRGLNAMLDELRDARVALVRATDAARRRVERDLHDGAQQQLVLLALKLTRARRLLGRDPAAAALDELTEDLDRALAQLRELARGIYPATLENEGLQAALREAVNRAPIPATFAYDEGGRYAREIEVAMYFCCLEALQNAAKHAGEGVRATVTLARADGELRLEVADDGAGYDPAQVTGGTGLRGLRDRLGALGGSLRIDSSPGRGTRVAARVPIGGPGHGRASSASSAAPDSSCLGMKPATGASASRLP